MSIKEQVRYILRKYPESRYSRGKFMWNWAKEYLGINIGLSREQFLEFWEHEAGLERSLRECLKEPEFKLKPEQDSKRYEKASLFKQENKNEKT